MKLKLFVFLLACLIPAAASAIQPNSLVVFGESTSDSGNVYFLFGEPAGDPWYTNKRIGDGPNWADLLADYFPDIPPLEASSYGGTNYAIAGADSSFGPGVWGLGSTGMQVTQYLDDTETIGKDVLIAFWIGGNDIGVYDPSTSVSNISTQIGMLIDAGARYILIPNQGPWGLAPDAFAGYWGMSPAVVGSLTSALNRALRTELHKIKCSHPWVRIYTLDAHQLYLDVFTDPWTYGYEDVTRNALYDGLDPNVTLFWDGMHTTTRFHALMAEEAFAAVSQPDGGLKCHTPGDGGSSSDG
jgi:phospholipase/lecithinase/hemolysin